MLEERNVAIHFGLAGYNVKQLDKQDLANLIGQYLKAYMTNKDIGIIGPVSLIVSDVKEKE